MGLKPTILARRSAACQTHRWKRDLATAFTRPEELLQALQKIEQRLGRERDGEKWGPRIIDLDLLLYGKKTIKTDTLTVPHPGLHERDFVIIPLAEIAGNMTIPGKGPLSTLIADCENHSVKKLVV